MKWYYILLLLCLVIGPFDAMYMYVKAQKRRDALKKRKQEDEEDHSTGSDR